ncbi:hypothetical protein [Streptomyces humicola]|nr:hypothetical protein [Streptomyces humicola]
MERKSLVPLAIRPCETVDGTVDVTNRMEYEIDDTVRQAAIRR